MALLSLGCVGCGTTQSQQATEQLLMSDAVDRAVAEVNFSELSGKTVFLDTRYITTAFKPIGFVSADYIISALRQQLMSSNCQLQDAKEDAEYIVEARVGALGTDGHHVLVGVPASTTISSAAALVPNAPPIPTIPEISFVRRDDKTAAAKIAVFAYHRETKRPVWQSGIAQARSKSHDTWVLGAGPFQRGSIHGGTQFAGSAIDVPLAGSRKAKRQGNGYDGYREELRYVEQKSQDADTVVPASHEEEDVTSTESDAADQ